MNFKSIFNLLNKKVIELRAASSLRSNILKRKTPSRVCAFEWQEKSISLIENEAKQIGDEEGSHLKNESRKLPVKDVQHLSLLFFVFFSEREREKKELKSQAEMTDRNSCENLIRILCHFHLNSSL